MASELELGNQPSKGLRGFASFGARFIDGCPVSCAGVLSGGSPDVLGGNVTACMRGIPDVMLRLRSPDAPLMASEGLFNEPVVDPVARVLAKLVQCVG